MCSRGREKFGERDFICNAAVGEIKFMTNIDGLYYAGYFRF